ncbi:MAG: hypothetical protein FWG01_00820 [Betaproteobacteria bacterium]|nr:hypothetical protein [Betaproteobacteria bacterium]
MKKYSYYSYLLLDDSVKQKLTNICLFGNNREQAVGFFRLAIGLYYLSRIMVEDELDFKAIDKNFNRFIFDVVGRGHSITSVLQYISSRKALWVLESRSFLNLFLDHFPDIPFSKILILLTVNLSVSKKISGLPVTGPLRDWLMKQNEILGITGEDETVADAAMPLPPPVPIKSFSAAVAL